MAFSKNEQKSLKTEEKLLKINGFRKNSDENRKNAL
jgi:hypothetical protein